MPVYPCLNLDSANVCVYGVYANAFRDLLFNEMLMSSYLYVHELLPTLPLNDNVFLPLNDNVSLCFPHSPIVELKEKKNNLALCHWL